jgi:hypothetical protein
MPLDVFAGAKEVSLWQEARSAPCLYFLPV